MRKIISIMFFAVLGIALSAFAPTKQEIETECTTTWEEGEATANPDGCVVTQWIEMRTCNGVSNPTGHVKSVSSCTNPDGSTDTEVVYSDVYCIAYGQWREVADPWMESGQCYVREERVNLCLNSNGEWEPTMEPRIKDVSPDRCCCGK